LLSSATFTKPRDTKRSRKDARLNPHAPFLEAKDAWLEMKDARRERFASLPKPPDAFHKSHVAFLNPLHRANLTARPFRVRVSLIMAAMLHLDLPRDRAAIGFIQPICVQVLSE
jgi:hypothetical protein